MRTNVKNHRDLKAAEIPSARVQRGRRPSVIASPGADALPPGRRLEFGAERLGNCTGTRRDGVPHSISTNTKGKARS